MSWRVFIIDDEPDLLDFYATALELEGHEVVGRATDGALALRKYAALGERPDVVLLDHRMPVKDGIETLQEILRLDPGARIVLISADRSIAEHAYQQGAVLVRAKPIGLADLLECVDRAAESPAARRPGPSTGSGAG